MSRKEYSDLLVDLYLTLFGLRQQVNTKGMLIAKHRLSEARAHMECYNSW